MELRNQVSPDPAASNSPGQTVARGRDAALWVAQLARTLKTCRLYDPGNPAGRRFRDELAASLTDLLAAHGTLQLRFTSEDVLLDRQSLYPARSREDNLASVFYRDGVRALVLRPGVEPREVDALVDALVRLTGPDPGQDDLNTLLWKADLHHMELLSISAENDVGESDAEGEEDGVFFPWPEHFAGEDVPTGGPLGFAGPGPGIGPGQGQGPAQGQETGAGTNQTGGLAARSDDWPTLPEVDLPPLALMEVASRPPPEIERFRGEYQTEHQMSLVVAGVSIGQNCLGSEGRPQECPELAGVLDRLLRHALSHGDWAGALQALAVRCRCADGPWSVEEYARELLQSVPTLDVIGQLDEQAGSAVTEFVAFARELGAAAVDWLVYAMAESQQRRTRRLLAEALAELCRPQPSLLEPWIGDPRWFVVRNVAYVLGLIADDSAVGILEPALRNPDRRVRREILTTLGKVNPSLARPLLLTLLKNSESGIFCAVLERLAATRDGATARILLGYLTDADYSHRPQDERQAILAALATAGVDEVLPDLEGELLRTNWPLRRRHLSCEAVAGCIAAIGTPRAREILDRGARSRRGEIRKACRAALERCADHGRST
jgi:hypothetical protein